MGGEPRLWYYRPFFHSFCFQSSTAKLFTNILLGMWYLKSVQKSPLFLFDHPNTKDIKKIIIICLLTLQAPKTSVNYRHLKNLFLFILLMSRNPSHSILVFRNLFLSTLFIYLSISISFISPGDRGSIPDRVIPKTKKWYLMPPYLTLNIKR